MIEERGGCSDRTDISFAFQTAFAAYSVPNKTDKFYDLAGSLGFISTTLVSLVRSVSVELHDHSSSLPIDRVPGLDRSLAASPCSIVFFLLV